MIEREALVRGILAAQFQDVATEAEWAFKNGTHGVTQNHVYDLQSLALSARAAYDPTLTEEQSGELRKQAQAVKAKIRR